MDLPNDVDRSEARRQRLEASARQRRIIFNDDTYELSREDANTPEGVLRHRLAPLVGTGVDTISWSVLGGWADAPVYDSKVQPIYGDAHGGPPGYWPLVTANVKALMHAGTCPLKVVIDFAHANQMEAFASIRMNDVHDSFVPGGRTTWKMNNPQWMVDPAGRLTNMELYVSSQDFDHAPVRQRKIEVIEEICHRYDVDGFELDFIRHPVFFSRTMRGEAATADQIDIMTALMRRIRDVTEAAAQQRGRPVLVAMRVPDRVELCKRIGLDVASWIAEDLLDLLIAGGGYAPFTLPVAELTELAHRHEVRIYPCINTGPAEVVSQGAFAEGVRALASNWAKASADGLYFWNLGSPIEYKHGQELIETRRKFYGPLKELGDPSVLPATTKLFCVDGKVDTNYIHMTSLTPLPVVTKPTYGGLFMRIRLEVGDDVAAAATNGTLAESTLRLTLRGPDHHQTLIVRFNGHVLEGAQRTVTNAEANEYDLTYPIGVPPLKQGANYIEASMEGGRSVSRKPPLEVYGARLRVRYGTPA